MRRAFAPVVALTLAFLPQLQARAQVDADTVTNVYQLGDLVIHGRAEGLNLEGFMRQVKEDTSFLHAFLNMRYFPHGVRSGLLVRNKGERETAMLYREGRLLRNGPHAKLQVDSISEGGKLRSRNGEMRYLTAELYDDLFWPQGPWRAGNSGATYLQGQRGSGRIGKYKDQLKKFMFNPGQEIAGLPFIGDKLALFDPVMTPYYVFNIGASYRNGHTCWQFSAVAKDSLNGGRASGDATVIKSMHTWFDQSSMQVIAREYRIANASLILDFDISILVDNALVGGELVPTFIRYDGDWDIPFKKRELVRFWLAMTDWVTGP